MERYNVSGGDSEVYEDDIYDNLIDVDHIDTAGDQVGRVTLKFAEFQLLSKPKRKSIRHTFNLHTYHSKIRQRLSLAFLFLPFNSTALLILRAKRTDTYAEFLQIVT